MFKWPNKNARVARNVEIQPFRTQLNECAVADFSVEMDQGSEMVMVEVD